MRVVAQDVAIVAGAGLALVRVAHEVLLHRRVARHEAPLHAGRESRAAAAAQARSLHLVDDRFAGRLLAQDLLPDLVAADACDSSPESRACRASATRTARGSCLSSYAPMVIFSSSRILSSFSGVSYSWNTWSTITIGAPVQAARHSSSRLRKMRPSGVLSFELDAELLLGVRHQLLAAVQHAGDVRADADVVPAARDGSRTWNRTWRPRRPGWAAGSRYSATASIRSGGQVAVVLLLRGAQRGDAGRALPPRRKLRHPVVDFLAGVLGQHFMCYPRVWLIGRSPRTRCPACRSPPRRPPACGPHHFLERRQVREAGRAALSTGTACWRRPRPDRCRTRPSAPRWPRRSRPSGTQ